MIAVAQAGVGFIEDARKTVSIIEHSNTDIRQDAERDETLCAIAVAQVKANDTEAAVRTALSVKRFVQYRDDALHHIVDHHIAKRDFKTALATADVIDNPSRKAAAILKVATAVAKSGDHKTAADIAARIELSEIDPLPKFGKKEQFDFRRPRSWGICYEDGRAFTIASQTRANRHSAEVAGAAMGLSQALGERPAQSYAVLFNDILKEEVILALARAHAASGDPSEALAWARQIGSGDKVNSEKDDQTSWAVQRRIYALIGVAEGILDRSAP
jgi:hypothetical protein